MYIPKENMLNVVFNTMSDNSTNELLEQLDKLAREYSLYCGLPIDNNEQLVIMRATIVKWLVGVLANNEKA